MGSLLHEQYEIYGQGGGPPLLLDSDFEQQHHRKRRKISTGPNNAVGQILAVASQNKGKTPSPSKLPGGFPPEYSFRALGVYSFLRTLSVRLRLSPFTPNVFLRALYLPYPNKLLGEIHVCLLRVLLLNLNLGYGFKQKGAITHYHKRRLIDNLRMPLRGGDNLTYLDGLSWPLFFDDYSHLTVDRLWQSLSEHRSYVDIRITDTDTLGYPDYQDEQFVAENETKILHSKPYIFPAPDYPPPTASTAAMTDASKSAQEETPKSTIDGESGQDKDTSPSTQKLRGRRLPIHKKSGPILKNQPSELFTPQTAQKNSLVYGVEHALYPGIQLPSSSPDKHPGLRQIYGHSTEAPTIPGRPLNVGDNVANALRNFVCKIPSERVISVEEDMSDSSAQFVKDEELPNDDRHFIHFEAMKAMRSGIPYHRLPLSQKVDMLEFLVDELLDLPEVAAEFSMRHGSLCVYPYPYGGWPKKSELESLNNEDQCGICRLEGDLLCCDGCSRSYHKACIGMKAIEELPEGEWLCPECQVVDPSKFGPLHGGQKASVDWVKASDVKRRIQAESWNQSNSQHVPLNTESVPSILHLNSNPSQHPALIGNQKHSMAVGPSGPTSNIAVHLGAHTQLSVSTGQNYLLKTNGNRFVGHSQHHFQATSIGLPNQVTAPTSSVSGPTTQPMPQDMSSLQSDEFSFLIVHGFVFRRNDSDLSGTSPYTALLEAEVNDLTNRFRLSISKEWPFRQIPTPWDAEGIHFPSLQNYFPSTESFNPSKFINKYKGALVPHSFKISGGMQDISMLSKTFESECNSSTSRLLTEAMQRDMSLDSHIATCLARQTNLFNPYDIVAGYMLKLDASLRKACLMDGSWESGKIRAVHEVWTVNVKKSKSVYRLANLLVKLVDHIHPRAFLEGWFHNSVLKKQESEHMSERNYETLPADWDKKQECRKRRWETTPSNMLMALCAREKVELSSFVKGINPGSIQITAVRSQRKKARTSADKHAEKMMGQVAIVTKEVSTSGTARDVDMKPTETISVYVDTSDIIPPQKPYPAYFQFANKRRLEMKEKYPGISSIEISKMLSDIWKNETDEFREKFSIEETKQRKEYKIAMEEYNKKIRERVAAAQASSGEKDTGKGANDDGNTDMKQSNTNSVVVDRSGSRRSRRSGRIARNSDHNEPSAATFTSIASGQVSSNTLNSKISIQDSKRKHMIAAEKLLKSVTQKENFWPLAGRIPFATVGDLPPKVMKRLARNGGVAIAPHVAYNSAHEVGQVCNAHIWRKKTSVCRSFEDLIYLARRLESFLDRQAMHSFEGTVRRGKSQFLKEVRCSQNDPGSGLLYHFVVNKKSGRGCWMSEDMMDVASSTLEQLKRRNKQVDLRRERAKVALLARKAEEERARAALMARKAEEERARVALLERKAEEERARLLARKAEEERARVALLAKKAEEAKKAFTGAANLSSIQLQRVANLHLAAQQKPVASVPLSRQLNANGHLGPNASVNNHNVGLSHQQGKRPQAHNNLSGIQMQLKLSLKRHEMDTRQLFQSFSLVGMRPTAENGLALRKKNFQAVKSAATELQKFQPDFLSADSHIIGMMKHVEKVAVGVSLDSLSGNKVENRLKNDQQDGAMGGNNPDGRRPILPREGTNVAQSFQMPQSNLTTGLEPTPITDGQLNGRGANGSSLYGNLLISSNRQQSLAPIGQVRNATGQRANMGMSAGQIVPNLTMNSGSSLASASGAPNNTGFNQQRLAPRAQLVSTMQSSTNRPRSSLAGMRNTVGNSVGGVRLNQGVGRSQGWTGMGNFEQALQAGGSISSTSASQAFLQQSRQQNVGPNMQRQVPQQFSQQQMLQTQNFQKQNLMGQQQLQGRGQMNLAHNAASQRPQFNQNVGTVPTSNPQQGMNALNQQQLQRQLPGWLQKNFFPSNGMQ